MFRLWLPTCCSAVCIRKCGVHDFWFLRTSHCLDNSVPWDQEWDRHKKLQILILTGRTISSAQNIHKTHDISRAINATANTTHYIRHKALRNRKHRHTYIALRDRKHNTRIPFSKQGAIMIHSCEGGRCLQIWKERGGRDDHMMCRSAEVGCVFHTVKV